MTHPIVQKTALLSCFATGVFASSALANLPEAFDRTPLPQNDTLYVGAERTSAISPFGILFANNLVEEREARNAIYVEATSLIVFNNVALNAERWLTPYLGLSIGVFHDRVLEISLFDSDAKGFVAYGARAQVHLLAGGLSHSAEIALGLTPYFSATTGEAINWQKDFAFSIPTAFLGYRHQRSDGEGRIFRIGLALASGESLGPSLSLGKAF